MRLLERFISAGVAVFIAAVVLVLNVGCGNEPKNAIVGQDCIVSDFVPISNLDSAKTSKGLISLMVDYSDAMQGINIPSVAQSPEKFEYGFRIKNTTKEARKFQYRLYYQNESYKFPEVINGDSSLPHPLSGENFYGSWDDQQGLRETPVIPADGAFHEIRGYFRIQGNPRNEVRYMEGAVNQRWKRNPRMGKYSFLLVVNSTEATLPAWYSDISLTEDSTWVNPYYYFLYGDGKRMKSAAVITTGDTLSVSSDLPLEQGVFIEPSDYSGEQYTPYYCSSCGQSPELQKSALFRQFIHYVDSSSAFNNIPVIADVQGDAYTLTDYNWNRCFHSQDEYIHTKPQLADFPCAEISVDTINKSIQLTNRAAERGRWEKQNVGIITRVGMTYGTYTVKVKMPQLLNKHGIWNGLTNAIWLITQSNAVWNNRRNCNDEGYIIDYYNADKSRSPLSAYSEIDFEILKTGPYCPEYSYQNEPLHPLADRNRREWWDLPYPGENERSKDEIMVGCTNWDMACPEPSSYQVGCQDLIYQGNTYSNHRWDYWYKAITSKAIASDNELFGGAYYYFQIVWKPEEIIWKIGPEKNKLRVVGYMNDGMTSVPNNQMALIISQEFHNTKWWPGSPFSQGDIPFPAKAIVGEVFEVTIE